MLKITFAFIVLMHFLSCDDDTEIPPEETKLEEIEMLIQSEMTAWKINALAVTLINDGEHIYSKGFGISNLADQTATTDESLFATSSISKLVVAVAIMQQVESGTIELDEDVEVYLGYPLRNPDFPDQVITPRLLLTHQSSLANPTFAEVPELSVLYTDTIIALGDWIPDYLVPDGAQFNPGIWKDHAPNTIHLSSNMGVTLLAHLVEKVTGKDFRDYTEENIFLPLGMTNTSYRMSVPGSYDESLLVDHFAGDGSILPDYFELALYPAGMLRTSALEWGRFFLAVINRGEWNGVRILQESSVTEMLDIKFPNAGLAFNSGIGLIWRSYGSWLGHTGGGFVMHSTDLNISNGKAVIILTNGFRAFTVSPDPQGKIYHALHDFLLDLN